jgi:formylmethanofuran dehydrogenase subunit E
VAGWREADEEELAWGRSLDEEDIFKIRKIQVKTGKNSSIAKC